MSGEEWQNSLHRGDPWVSQKPDRSEEAQVPMEVTRGPLDLGDVERDTGSGGDSTDLTRGPSLASPRLIPLPDFPPPSIQLPPDAPVVDVEPVSASLNRVL